MRESFPLKKETEGGAETSKEHVAPGHWEKPEVDTLVVYGLGVLIKTKFQRDASTAAGYILVSAPTQEYTTDRAVAYTERKFGRPLTDDEKNTIQNYHNTMNSPLVFETFEEVQEWFGQVKTNFSDEERARVASFLGITEVRE